MYVVVNNFDVRSHEYRATWKFIITNMLAENIENLRWRKYEADRVGKRVRYNEQ